MIQEIKKLIELVNQKYNLFGFIAPNHMTLHAIALAKEKHQGQTDLLGNNYFQNHIRGVTRNVLGLLNELREQADIHCCGDIDAEEEYCNWMGLGEFVSTVAYLHDIFEDTDVVPDNLREMRYPELIVEAIRSVTRRPNEKYKYFIKRSKKNILGRLVKMADLQNNLDIRRIKFSVETEKQDLYRIKKYIKSYLFLEDKMSEEDYLRK